MPFSEQGVLHSEVFLPQILNSIPLRSTESPSKFLERKFRDAKVITVLSIQIGYQQVPCGTDNIQKKSFSLGGPVTLSSNNSATHCSLKAAVDNLQVNGCGFVSIKFYLQKQVQGIDLAHGHSLPTLVLYLKNYLVKIQT